jgi:5'-nucleotidase
MGVRILLTNDDGIESTGIAVLRHALEGLGTVTTIAPARNSSGVARSITIHRPLHLQPVRFGRGWAGLSCDGTPADCVRIGFLGLHGPLPDLVVSGVNLGPNLGADVTYSGTVGAAFEAALRGRPGIAFSVNGRRPGWLAQAGPVLRKVVEAVLARGMPPTSLLNVNLPDAPLSEIAGIRPARLGGASCHDKVFLSGDGDGHVPLAVPSPVAARDSRGSSARPAVRTDSEGPEAAIDFDVVAEGYVAVTPLRYDLLDAAFLRELDTWDLDGEPLRV